ncbi:MAG: hypothetical protein SOR40_00270 [Rothia sp. (in: high G+C Gram-positive bacteria)]|nr:hypothetical protein [Rothia sp. (in: high G+C Gram-positive bacteria)]
MTESQPNPDQQATPGLAPVGSDVLWVRLPIDLKSSQLDWRQQVPLLFQQEQAPSQPLAEQEQPLRLEDEVRNQLESIIGLIREQASAQAAPELPAYTDEDLKSLDELVADPEKFDSLIEQIIQVEDGLEASEEGSDEAGQQEEQGQLGQEVDSSQVEEEQAAVEQPQQPQWQISPDLLDLLHSQPTVTALETDGQRAQLFILCERPSSASPLQTVEASPQGQLLAGQPLKDFLSQLEQALPGLTERLPSDEGQDYHLASFSEGADSLSLDPCGVSAALVEISTEDLASYLQGQHFGGQLEAAPADRGWSLISADPAHLAALLQSLNLPSIVAEQTLFGQSLSFVLPADSSCPSPGLVSDWVNQLVGSPETDLVGTVLTFSWSPLKKEGQTLTSPSSEVGNLVWSLPGLLPEPYREIAARDQLEQLIWFYGLDEQTANRLTNYVLDFESRDGMESTIHALDLPEELYLLLGGAVRLDDFVGYFRYDADQEEGQQTLGGQEEGQAPIQQAASYRAQAPALAQGQGLSSLARPFQLQKPQLRPWLLAADATAQLGASGALAIWAARRAAQGRSPRAALIAAATLGASGAAELLIARTYHRLVTEQQEPENHQLRPLSLTEELRAQVQAEAEAQAKSEQEQAPGPYSLAKAQQLGRQLGQSARQQLGRFFGIGNQQ